MVPIRPHRPQDESPARIAPPRIYRGTRKGSRRIVEVFRAGERTRTLDPRLDLATYTRDDFEWATGHAGRHQLALAILADAIGDRRIALAYHEDFKREVIMDLPWQGWELSSRAIHDWLVGKAIEDLKGRPR